MVSSSFRSATVEEYDEGPGHNDSRGEAPPYAEGSLGNVGNEDSGPSMTQEYQPHLRESRAPVQSYPAQIQPTSQYPSEEHHAHQQPSALRPYGNVEPPATQLPTAPTPPPNLTPKKAKRKVVSSSRRRSKDRPEYYGVRGPSTSVVPGVLPDPAPRSSNIRIARRPTTGWYVSGSLPGGTAGPEPTDAVNSPARIHGPSCDNNRPPRNAPSVNAFRNSGAVQIRGQHPPPQSHHADDSSWETGGRPNHGLEQPHPGRGATNHPSAQPDNPDPGFIVLSQGQRGPPNAPDNQANDIRGGHAQPQLPPQAPTQHNPHGLIVLSSNNNRPADPADEQPCQRSFYQLSSTGDQRRFPSPSPQPMPLHDDRGAADQIAGRQSVQPVHLPPTQPPTNYSRFQGYSSQDTRSSQTPGPCPEFQRLSLEDAPHRDRRVQRIPPHASAGQFRSQDIPAPSSRPDGAATSSHDGPVYPPSQGYQGRQHERYPSGNEHGHYTPHPQRRQSHDQHHPVQNQTAAENPASTAPGDWPEAPRKWTPRTPHPQRHSDGFHSIPEESNRLPPSAGQIGYPTKTPRAGLPRGHYQPRDEYHGPEEDFEPNIHEPSTASSHKHPGDPPTLPDGHPFLRMKDMALAAILKEFRAWQTSGMPGRRGPHSRRPPFSCPFAKKDPVLYRDCFSDALPGIADVKEHISRCHSIPIYCPRCMDLFDDEKARDHHIRHGDCRPQQWSCPDGITESQKRQLRTNVPTYLPPPDQWAHIFSIVFPQRAPTPESPYVDETLHEDVSTYRDFLEARGPRTLSDVLTFRGAATWNLPNEERDLTAFRCLVLDEGIRDLVDQWARRHGGGGDSLRSPPSLASSSGAGPQRTPSMGSFASSEGRAGVYLPSSPAEAHHWDPRPRIHGDGCDEYGGHAVENVDYADPRRQKVPMYAASRREPAPY